MLPTLSDDRPIYLQLKEYIEGEILNGSIGDDEQIPSTNELASFFGINPVTVLKGVTMLTDEGTIYKKRGIGMFVSPGAQDRIQKRYRTDFAATNIMPLVQRARSLHYSHNEFIEEVDKAWEADAQEDER